MLAFLKTNVHIILTFKISNTTASFQLGVTGHKMLEREVAILKRVQHPHIVALEEVFETSEVRNLTFHHKNKILKF